MEAGEKQSNTTSSPLELIAPSLSHTLSLTSFSPTLTHTLTLSLSHSLSTVHIHTPTLAGCHSLHLPLIAHSSQPTDHLRADQQPHFRIRPQHHNNNNHHPQAPEQIPTRTRAGQSRAKQIGVEQSRAEQISAVVLSLRALLLRPGRNAGHSFPSPFCALTIYQHAHPRLATITPCRLYLCAECHSNCSTRQTRSPAPTEPQWRDNRNSRAVRRHQFRPSTWSRRRYHTGQRRRLLAVDLVAMDCQQWLWIYSGDHPARGGCHGQTAQS